MEKHVKTIENPKMDIYITKPEYQNYDYIKTFMPIAHLDKHRVDYRNICFEIAQLVSPEYVAYVKECYTSGRRYEAKNVHLHPYVLGSDYDIENWYRTKFVLEYEHDHPTPITKSYLDIEVDGIDIPGFPQPGECPINAISYVDESERTVYTFLLRNPDNPLIEEFERNIADFKKALNDTFSEFYGELTYRILMYDDEAQMLRDTFRLINANKRDFLMIWHIAFDIPFILARCDVLGIDPVELMCSDDFLVKDLYFKKDMKNFKVEYKGDYFKLSSHTVYLDQMLVYASSRKGQGELRSYSLNYVAQVELGDTKLDYSEEANIKTLPYVNYAKFVMYSIKDTLLQCGIEGRTLDVENVYLRCTTNATSYEKIFRQTVFLKSRAYLEYYKQGFIIGNNPNLIYGKNDHLEEVVDDPEHPENFHGGETKKGFVGAIVGNPLLNNATGIKLLGKRSSFIFDNTVDFDYSAMYPNTNIAFNISPNTMYGKVIVDKEEGDPVGRDVGKDFLENLTIGNHGSLGREFFNLPGFDDLYREFREDFINERIKEVIVVEKDDHNKAYVPTVVIELKKGRGV